MKEINTWIYKDKYKITLYEEDILEAKDIKTGIKKEMEIKTLYDHVLELVSILEDYLENLSEEDKEWLIDFYKE